MKPDHIFLGLPSYDSWKNEFAISLISTLQGGPCKSTLFAINGDSLVCRARNNLAQEFLESDCSHLMFLDVDLQWNPRDMWRLWSHDLPIVGGLYLQKRYDVQIPILNRIAGEETQPNGLMRVRHVGTGMMLIAREVFERLIETGKAARYHTCDDEAVQRHMHDFFAVGVHVGRYESEDWAFCRMAREVGYEVWCDTSVPAAHHGSAKFPNDAVEQLKLKWTLASQWIAKQPKTADRDAVLAELGQKLHEEGRR